MKSSVTKLALGTQSTKTKAANPSTSRPATSSFLTFIVFSALMVSARIQPCAGATVIPNDPQFPVQWNLSSIGAPSAWAITTGSTNVVVAVIDTGVDYNHPDLAANMWRNPGETGLDANGHDKATNGIDDDGDGYIDDVYGINIWNHDSNPMALTGHGTACAGIIGVVGTDHLGLAGVNWSVQMMPLVFWTQNPGLWLAAVLENFEYVIQQRRRGVNVRVTNNSYGRPFYSQALKDAIDIAGAEGVLTVCAALNY